MRFCETTLGCYFALLFGHNGAPDGIGYFVCSYGGELDAVVPHRYGVLRLVHGTAICRSAEIAFYAGRGNMSEYPRRKPNRLSGYDYSKRGAYFVTLCTCDKECFFELEKDLKSVPLQNQIIHRRIRQTEERFGITAEKYVLMPNHIHIIFVLNGGVSLAEVMRWFKTSTTNDYIKGVKENGFRRFSKKLWQKSYHDHIIRGEEDYLKIWNYIDTNTLKWELDKYYEK